MTYNIRYGLADDGENSWKFRKDNIVNLINFYEPNIFGTQEGLPFQVNYITEKLPHYKYIGADRDGNGRGENTAIFYDINKFNVIEHNTFWLAPDQNKPSKAWDAAYPRIYTYGLFEDKMTQKKFWIINSHFDHVGAKARVNSAKIILEKIKEINTENHLLIFMGDLNAEINAPEINSLKKQLTDTKELSVKKPFGPIGTFNNFEFKKPVTILIDYIFVNNRTIKINKHAVLSDSENLKYPSDHFPVYIELTY